MKSRLIDLVIESIVLHYEVLKDNLDFLPFHLKNKIDSEREIDINNIAEGNVHPLLRNDF